MEFLYRLYQQNESKAITFMDQALVSGSNFIFSLIYTRVLGLEVYGSFVMMWMVVLCGSAIQTSFIFTPMNNIYAALTGGNKLIYKNVLLIIQLLFAAFFSLVVYSLLLINGITFQQKALIEVTSALPFLVFGFLMHDYFRRSFALTGKFYLTLLFDFAQVAIMAIVFYVFSTANNISLNQLFWINTLSYSIPSFVGLVFFTSYKGLATLKSAITQHWQQGKWLIATAALQLLSGNYFLIIAGSILGTREIGIIRVAQNIVGVLNILFIALESYVPISSARIFHKKGTAALFTYLISFTIKGLLITSLICFLIAVFSEQILSVLYGSLYLKYAHVVVIFAIFYVIVFVGMPLRLAIKTLDHNQHIFIGYLISAVFSLISAEIIIEYFGLYGVIVGFVLTQLLTQAWYIFSLKKYLYEYYTCSSWKS